LLRFRLKQVSRCVIVAWNEFLEQRIVELFLNYLVIN